MNPRSLFRLSGLKATPPLATSPEGRGRDSDNNEVEHTHENFVSPDFFYVCVLTFLLAMFVTHIFI
jgi:hypothetical protein